MRQTLVIKPGPLALVKRIIVLEVLVSVILFGASFLANYEQFLYQSVAVIQTHIIRYNVLSAIIGSIIQLSVTLGAFFYWYRERYEFGQQEFTYKSGIIFRKHHVIPLSRITAVNYERGPVERFTGSGTIILELMNGTPNVVMSSIEDGHINVRLITDLIEKAENQKNGHHTTAKDLIKAGENQTVEFKQTLRWDIRQKVVNKALEKGVLKTVAGFLNASGGTLVIGVDDNGQICGLADDYQSLVRKDRDGFENHFTQVFASMLGPEWRQLAKLHFDSVNDKDVCLVEVSPSPGPVYLKYNGEEEFYVRTGNTTTALSLREAADYLKTHWG